MGVAVFGRLRPYVTGGLGSFTAMQERRCLGSGMARAAIPDEVHAARILEATVKAVRLPVTLKMRTGWDSANRNAPNLARIAQECGIKMLTVHASGGGKMMADLIEHLFAPAFANDWLGQMGDSTVLDLTSMVDGVSSSQAAFTTDSFVVSPLFFPGGDIGTLAVNGTVNDLAMCGARPRWLSAGFILEEGLSMATLA